MSALGKVVAYLEPVLPPAEVARGTSGEVVRERQKYFCPKGLEKSAPSVAWQRGLGVIGQVGSTLGKLGVNIATFALGRRNSAQGAEAVSLVRLDGEVSASILEPIRGIPAVTE